MWPSGAPAWAWAEGECKCQPPPGGDRPGSVVEPVEAGLALAHDLGLKVPARLRGTSSSMRPTSVSRCCHSLRCGSCRPGRPPRAALLGAGSIGVASISVNAVAKMLLHRQRPDRITAAVPVARQVRMPHSTSFPSGHSAPVFAFASAVGTQLPRIALPLQLLAAAVASSRIHTGVHYPNDTTVGASIGMAAAAATASVARHLAVARRSA